METEDPQPSQSPQKSPRRATKQVKVEPAKRNRASAVEDGQPKRGAIADTVKKMKNVLSPQKVMQDG